MVRKRYKAEEIIQHLRTAEIEQGKAASLEQTARSLQVSPQTLIRWRKESKNLFLSVKT